MRVWWRRCDENNENNSDNNGDAAVEESNDVVAKHILESEILYSIESFGAVVAPVTITMVLSALVVVFVNTDETIAAGEEAYAKAYQVFDVGNDDESSSSLEKLGLSLVNTLVMVSVICVMTFVVVLCYKYRCMKIFYAYMVLATAGLLSYFSSSILLVFMSIYPWINTDKLTFAFLMYNYTIVGTVAIFLPRGIPQWVTQGYLIASSVCLAWQLSYFNSWMAWTLLVMLALYDLFAVLTPCGPLKALAELISEEGAPALPGLLYEAALPSGVAKPGRKNTRRRTGATESGEENQSEERGNETICDNIVNENNNDDCDDDDDDDEDDADDDYDGITNVSGHASSTRQAVRQPEENEPPISLGMNQESSVPQQQQPEPAQGEPQVQRPNEEGGKQMQTRRTMTTIQPSCAAIEGSVDLSNHGQVPLALAKLYRLPVLDTRNILRRRSIEPQQSRRIGMEGNVSSTDDTRQREDLAYYTGAEIRSIVCTPQQLKTEVTCVFPPRGGRIVRARARDQTYDTGTAYIVYDRTGNQQRKFVITPQGSVMEVLLRESSLEDDNETNDKDDNNTIKLGLGDFIFYSVLVSKAAQYSFTAFAACLLVVLSGLATTLVILAIQGKALPALPISIFLGVITFLWTATFLQPWVHDFFPLLIYV